jgi:hypothetical protein
MRAFAVQSFGEPASVQDLPVPAADGGPLAAIAAFTTPARDRRASTASPSAALLLG